MCSCVWYSKCVDVRVWCDVWGVCCNTVKSGAHYVNQWDSGRWRDWRIVSSPYTYIHILQINTVSSSPSPLWRHNVFCTGITFSAFCVWCVWCVMCSVAQTTVFNLAAFSCKLLHDVAFEYVLWLWLYSGRRHDAGAIKMRMLLYDKFAWELFIRDVVPVTDFWKCI